MSTAIAVSTVALSMAAKAEHDAKMASCQAFMPNFVADGAAPEAARRYAECVALLYPNPMTSSDIWVMKLFIVIAICGAIAGFVYGRKDYLLNDAMGTFLSTVMGAIFAPAVAFLLVLVAVAIKFLFT